MAYSKRFSKDPKVYLVSLEEFYQDNDYLCGITKDDLWETTIEPGAGSLLFKFTPQYLISTFYDYSFSNYGMDVRERLSNICVAMRDGVTEFELLDARLKELKEKRDRFKDKKKIDDQIAGMEYARTLIPRYEEKVIPSFKPYRSYLVDTGYKTEIENLRNKYLVFDVETNGLRQSNDDLLSLSIYDPTTGLCYNRFFPLDLQPLILTGFINGIDDATLADATHITQHEFDWLKDFFHFEDRIFLSFSGGKGNFDPNFLKNYLQRQKVNGFEDLKFENIKSRIPPAPFYLRGELKKDNLCKLFGIDGVNEIHSSFNDCLLEWKLFEKLESKCHFFNGDSLYEYTPEYIIPYSILVSAPVLAKFAGITIPEIDGKATEIFKFDFPKNLLRKIKKFPTNITGICIEHGINCYLHAERQDNLMFLAQNKARLKYIGTLTSNVETIRIHQRFPSR